MKNAGIEITTGKQYKVVRAGCSYLGVGGTYKITVNKRTIDFRNVATGSGTSVTAWEIQQGLVILAEVNS